MNTSFKLTLVLAVTAFATSTAGAQDKIDFVKQIKPIFEQYCFECHGADPDDYEAFPINDKDEAMAYVDVDSIDDSDLYQVMISDDEDWVMPPPDYKHQLGDEQKALIKTWIEQGADWPDGVEFVIFKEDQSDSTAPTDPVEPPVDQATQPDQQPDPSETEEETDPEPVDPKTQRMFNAVGSLHPAAVHLPIGLLLASGLFALLGIRGNFVMSDCAYYCLWLGTLGAIGATVSGWYFSPMENRGTVEVFQDIFDTDHKVYWHRLGGLIVTIFSLILALFAASARSRDPDEGVMWKLGAILLACGIGWVGHTGGELHYPPNHYKDLEAIWTDLTSGEATEEAEETNAGESEPSESDADDTSQVGTASDAGESGKDN